VPPAYEAKVYSNAFAFAALKADGSITAWGNSLYGGTGAPSDNGYTKIYSTMTAFTALKADGSIKVWGGSG
jgi:alpha-tubulin suppressor-like RCC1 family protein